MNFFVWFDNFLKKCEETKKPKKQKIKPKKDLEYYMLKKYKYEWLK